jgi:hypothetical protein
MKNNFHLFGFIIISKVPLKEDGSRVVTLLEATFSKAAMSDCMQNDIAPGKVAQNCWVFYVRQLDADTIIKDCNGKEVSFILIFQRGFPYFLRQVFTICPTSHLSIHNIMMFPLPVPAK